MSVRPSFDAIILGGGPAGSMAAALLARSNVRTIMLDKIQRRYRTGEILDSRALALLKKFGLTDERLEPALTPVPAHDITWGTEGQMTSAVANPYGPGMILDRNKFDMLLRREAAHAGAVVFETECAPEIEHADGRWSAVTNAKERTLGVIAPILIDCTGRRASVIRRYGQRKRIDRLVCDYYLTTTETDPDSHWSIVADEHGWWFTVRVGARARVFCHFHEQICTRIEGDSDLTTSKCPMADVAQQLQCKVRECWRVDASTYVFDSDHPALASAGDAAFTIDPLSGQGASLAIAQGLLAAGACLQHLDGSRTALSDLRTLQIREFAATLRRRLETYSTCVRWKEASFWSNRQNHRTST